MKVYIKFSFPEPCTAWSCVLKAYYFTSYTVIVTSSYIIVPKLRFGSNLQGLTFFLQFIVQGIIFEPQIWVSFHSLSLTAPILQNAPDSSNKWPTVNTPALIHCGKNRTLPLYRILLLFLNRWSSRRYIGTRSWVTLRFELCSTHACNTDFQN